MLKKICFLSLLFISGFVEGQRFNAYLMAGAAASQVSGDALGGFDKAGIASGAGVITPISKKLKMGFEIGYLQKGSRKPSRLDQGDPVQYKLRLNYLEIPVYLSTSINRKLSVYAGPSVGILISSREENENDVLTYSLPFNRIDISIAGGLNYSLSERWDAGFRGIQSLLPVREFGGATQPFFDGGQYNSVITVLLFYYFKDKEK